MCIEHAICKACIERAHGTSWLHPYALQDRGFITYPLANDRSMALLAVYDGHGSNGEQISEYVMLKVPDMLEAAGGAAGHASPRVQLPWGRRHAVTRVPRAQEPRTSVL